MAALEHACRYPFASQLEVANGDSRLLLATSGGAEPSC